jgi:hypothetical protein
MVRGEEFIPDAMAVNDQSLQRIEQLCLGCDLLVILRYQRQEVLPIQSPVNRGREHPA